VPTTERSLVRKLAEVANSIGRVPKNGYNSFHKYHYVMEADLVDHVRPLLSERNIFIVPRVGSRSQGENYSDFAHEIDDGLTSIVYEYEIIDGDSGESLITSAVGYGSDKGDKGAYKASTGAFKYMLMRLFMVATGDDPEGDERTDARVSGGSGPSVRITSTAARPVGRGGRSDGATTVQINSIKQTSKELGLGIEGISRLIERVLGDKLVLSDVPTIAANTISDYLEDLSGEDAGKLLTAMAAAGNAGISVEEAMDLKVGEHRSPDESE
jgi:hypothetical protein